MSQFFIDRPVFAWVLAILVMLAGGLSLNSLPVAQYPEIASPQVIVSARYPGTSAKTMEDTVTQIIEQQISGIDGLLYMSSTSDSTGTATLTFTFENGTNVDIAQVQVQNKLQLALPMLPEEVQRQGLSVTKSSVGVLLIMSLYCAGMTDEDVGDYLFSHLRDPLSRISGIGQISGLGAQYAMRVWCDPAQMAQYRLNPSDVVAAIRAQNSQTAGGQTGAYPIVAGQEINLVVNASSRLETAGEFARIILKTRPDGSVLRLKDVARVELAGETFNYLVKNGGQPGAAVQFMLAPGANALDTAQAIKKKMAELSAFFPPGMEYVYAYDSTPFVEKSIREVFKTLAEAVILVFLVMFLFLQNFRATLIPTLAIPVVLLGTFGVLAAAGYSINTLTMFGLVLSIGLLVDDAIVVVENCERLMREENLSPREVARKSMRQISGALVGVALVIAAVFVPMAFMGGSVGGIYRQFSLTIVTAMTLSALVALVLSPALCATLLKSHGHKKRFVLFEKFNYRFDRLASAYQRQVGTMLTGSKRVMLAFGLGLFVAGYLFFRLPSSFVPQEDQGAMYAIVQLPPGATMERTDAVLARIKEYLLTEEADNILNVQTVAGFSFTGSGQNIGQAFIGLKDWSLRREDSQHVEAVIARTRQRFSDVPEARVIVFGPAPIKEMAQASGFEFELMDLTGRGHEALMEARDLLLDKARQHPLLRNVRHGGLDDVPQYDLHIDIEKAEIFGLRKDEINDAVSTYWGGRYVNDFTDRGRTKKVYVQAEARYRMQADDFDRYFIRNDQGLMVPFPSFVTVGDSKGSPRLERYQGVPAVKILGEAAAGRSSGQAMAAMEELAAGLPEGFGFQWTGLSYQERAAGSQAGFLYVISLIVVFLCLAALYESWCVPLAVLLAVPSGVLGAVAGTFLAGLENDVYFHIGLLAVMGLSAKNSILIIEFAREMQSRGEDLMGAVKAAVRIRLRPIIMTSLAFTLGVLPLALNSGAGSGAQNAVGTTVVCGVLSATFFGLYLTPLFYVGISRLFSKAAAPAANPKIANLTG